jgi:2,4-diketo-3-deoxy-L-fuconate hydrolase
MRLFIYRDPDRPAASSMVPPGVGGLNWLPGIRVGRLLPDDTVEQGQDPGRLLPDRSHEEGSDRPPIPASELTPAPAIPRPGKIVCIGLNYRDHVAEQRIELPDRPLLFAKFANAVIADGEPIVRPAGTHALDLEAELGVVIGVGARRVRAEDALAHVMGYVVVNDVSARDWQGNKVALRDGERGDGQWLRAKGSDTFFPIGPVLALADEFDGPPDLAIRSWRIPGSGPDAGRALLMQDSRTSNLVFSIPQLIEFVSRSITLDPGDIISTGTPGGVGVFRDPPVYLEPGDRVRVEIEGIGSVENPVVEWSDIDGDGPATERE